MIRSSVRPAIAAVDGRLPPALTTRTPSRRLPTVCPAAASVVKYYRSTRAR
jgi:hypothetical protein